jgi:hypothetical protein
MLLSSPLLFYVGLVLMCAAAALLLLTPTVLIVALNRLNKLLGFPEQIPSSRAGGFASKICGLAILSVCVYLIITSHHG